MFSTPFRLADSGSDDADIVVVNLAGRHSCQGQLDYIQQLLLDERHTAHRIEKELRGLGAEELFSSPLNTILAHTSCGAKLFPSWGIVLEKMVSAR